MIQQALHRRSIRVLAILLLLAGCASRQPGDPLTPGFNVYSPEDDIQIGRQAAQEIESQVQVVENDALQDYIREIGQRIADHPDAGPFPYSFTLVNDPSINAFALPGGPTYIHTGLVEAAANEGQLAGVIAHEISHVALRHGTSQASRGNLIQLPAILAGAVIGDGSAAAQLGQLGLGLGVNSLLLRYSRDAETEADALGARLMAAAGYDPIEMAAFFETLEAEQGGQGAPQFLSSHPNPGNRREAVRAEIATFPAGEYNASTGRFGEVKQMVAALPDPPERAVQQASAPGAPSGEMSELAHPSFRLNYPSQWNVYGDPQSTVVTIAPQDGLVQSQTGRVALGYGTVFGIAATSGGTLDEQTRAWVAELQSMNPQSQVRANPQSVTISGQAGLITELTGASPFGGAERNVVVTVQRPQGLFYGVFVSPEEAFGQASPVFQAMYESIRF